MYLYLSVFSQMWGGPLAAEGCAILRPPHPLLVFLASSLRLKVVLIQSYKYSSRAVDFEKLDGAEGGLGWSLELDGAGGALGCSLELPRVSDTWELLLRRTGSRR